MSETAARTDSSIPRPFHPGHRFVEPLPKGQREAVRAECLRALRLWAGTLGPGSVDPSLVPLRLSEKCQTFRARTARDGAWFVLKRHTREGSFVRELLAFELFAEGGRVPRLLAYDAATRCMALELLKKPFRVVDDISFRVVARDLGRMHACAALHGVTLRNALPEATAAAVARAAAAPPTWVADRAAYAALCGRLRDVFGPDHILFCLGDLKAEHLFEKREGCAFIDLETLSLGSPPTIDVVSLVNVAPDQKLDPAHWRLALESYLEGLRWGAHPRLGLGELESLVRSTAQSVDLPRNLWP